MNDCDVLSYDPWEGDRDSDARTLRDKMVVLRKHAVCCVCFDSIPVGARVRAQTQQSTEQRKVMTFKFCPLCCEAMAIAADDWEPINRRTVMGMTKAATR